MIKHKSNKLVFVLTGTIVLLLLFVLSIQVRPVVSQSISTQETNGDFSGEANISQVPTAGTLVCNSAAATFDSGLPVDWSPVVTTGPVVWSTTDNTAVCDNGYEAGGIAPGACADADQTNNPPVAYDTELRTNSFNLIGLVDASLDLQWRHRPLNGSVFDIDISTDGGGSWTNVMNDTTGNPSGAAGDSLSLDLSPFIGNNNVTARFRYYGVDWDWYVHLDDIRLSCEVPPPPENCTFGQWTPIASLNTGRSRTGAAYSDATGRFYVLGGEASGGNRDIPIEEYDVVNNVWIDKSLLNTGVSNSGAVAVGDYIYVPGGWTGVSAQAVMQRYDPVADSVTIMSPMPSANFAHAVTALGTDIYVLGGSITGTVGTTNFIYDTISDSWSSGAPLPTPTQYPAATSDGTYVYVLGGSTSDLNDVQRYDPTTDTWTTLTGMNVGRGGPGAFFDGANIWAVAGGWNSYLTNTEYWDGAGWVSGPFVTAGARTIGVAYNGSDRVIKAGGWAGTYVDAAETISVVCGPEIDVDPTGIEEELFSGVTATYPLTISNIGIDTLDWSLSDEAPNALSKPAPLPEYVAGLYAPSAGAAPVNGLRVISGVSPSLNPLSSKVRSWNGVGTYFTLFDLNTPEVLPSTAPFTGTGTFIGAGEFVNGLSYMVSVDNNVFVVDDTGTLQDQYTATAPPNGESYSGLALNSATGAVYASSTNIATSTLSTFDVLTGSATPVGPIVGSPGAIAISFDGAGNLFGYDIVTDNFMQIDPATGNTSNVVSLPFDANFGQGMGYDSATGLIYILAFNNGYFQAQLWTVDTSDPTMPVFAFEGELGAAVPSGLNQLTWGGTEICNPADIPWLSVSPVSGSTGSGLSTVVDVTLDTTGLPLDVYVGTLCINSNATVSPVVRVPVTMTVKELPDIIITAPVSGTVLTELQTTVEVTITDDFMIPEDGHWHILVDGIDAGPVMGYSGVVNLSPGTHELTAQLQAPDHTPLGPEDTIVVHVIGKLYLPTVMYNAVSYFVGPEQEPNDTSGQANGPLEPGRAYTGFPDDDRDYFSFVVNVPGNINVALSNYTGQGGQLQLFYQSTANRVGFDAEPPYNIAYQGQPGTYFVLIFTESGFNNTPYSLVVNTP